MADEFEIQTPDLKIKAKGSRAIAAAERVFPFMLSLEKRTWRDKLYNLRFIRELIGFFAWLLKFLVGGDS